MNRFAAFARLSRPHFLIGGFLMYAVGAAHAPSVDVGRYLVGQLTVTASQITAHYLNEYADVEHDRWIENRTMFSGGSGVLSGGELSPIIALRAAWVSTAVALLGVVLVLGVNRWAAVLGLLSLAVSWGYSMPPVRLLGRGSGELATSLIVAGGAPLFGSLTQDASPSSSLWWAVVMLVPAHLAMMLAFEVPDIAVDAASGKRVVAVRLGRSVTNKLIIALVALCACVAVLAAGADAVTLIWVLPAALPAVAMVWALSTDRYPTLTMSAVALFVTGGLGLLINTT